MSVLLKLTTQRTLTPLTNLIQASLLVINLPKNGSQSPIDMRQGFGFLPPSHPDKRCNVAQRTSAIHSTGPSDLVGRSDLDSHSNTCIAGSTYMVLEYTGVECDVFPYSDAYQLMKDIPVVQAATAYNHPSG